MPAESFDDLNDRRRARQSSFVVKLLNSNPEIIPGIQ
jgi:hypothetical protein